MSLASIKRISRPLFFFAVFALWAFLLWVLSTGFFQRLSSHFSKDALEQSALIGDTFGVFSALMAAFAAVGAVLALSEQRNAVKRQVFISTVVAMLDRLQQTIEDTDYFIVESVANDDETVTERIVSSQSGQNAFYEISQELRLYLVENFLPEMGENEKKGLIILLYIGFYEDYKDSLGHFFRQLYHIVKYIDEAGDDEKERFLKIVRASLTNAQLLLLAYNVIAGEGRVKFARYIQKYSLLHNLGFEDDELGRIEKALVTERLGERAIVSDTQNSDKLDPEFVAREKANSLAKIELKRFLDRHRYPINYGVPWHSK